jgi:hypothetical protein
MTNDHHECCLRCQSRRVVIGRFVGHGTLSTPAWFRCFQPSRFWGEFVYFLGLRQPLLLMTASESFLCLDCGTAWTSIDPQDAESQIRRRADHGVKVRLGLAEKPLIRDDDLA